MIVNLCLQALISSMSYRSIRFNFILLCGQAIADKFIHSFSSKWGWKLTEQRQVVGFWFHSAVQQESCVLVMCLFGLVKEVRCWRKKTTTTGCNTSHLISQIWWETRETKTDDARLKYTMVTSTNIQTSLIEGQAEFLSFANWHVITLRLFGKEEMNPGLNTNLFSPSSLWINPDLNCWDKNNLTC